MADDAHDMGLTVVINRIAHGLAVYRKAFVLSSVDFVPPCERSIQMDRINADETIADDGFAGNHATAVFDPAAKALPGLLA